jgi:hypothetical protein
MTVAIPQLFEPFAAYFLIDFLKYVGHAIALKLRRRMARPPGGSLRLASSNTGCRVAR